VDRLSPCSETGRSGRRSMATRPPRNADVNSRMRRGLDQLRSQLEPDRG
jgi:hypothetical protein